MIQSVEIKNLRGIQAGKLDDLSPLVVLVGPNSSGKSTILDALLIGVSSQTEVAIGQCVKRRAGVRRGARWLVWRANENNIAEIRVKSSDHDRKVSVTVPPSEPERGVSVRASVADSSDAVQVVSVRSVFIQPNNEYGPSGEPDLTGFPQVHLVENRDNSEPLYRIYTKAVEQGRRNEARALVNALIPGVQDVEILAEGDVPVLYLDYEDHSVPVSLAGDGLQSLLRVSLDIAARPGSLVLLEEPDIYQHPGAIWQTARAIWEAIRRDTQVILTTHSLDLIDALLGEAQTQEELDKMSVYRLLLQDGCLKSSRLIGSDISLARVEIGSDLR